jgi:dihydrolipoamide dehydrogenase
MTEKRMHVAVIGAGPGGYAAAFLAADLGMQVTLIDPAANPGGVCLYRGCIPSKALLHVAALINEAKAARAWGIAFDPPRIDLEALRTWKEGVVSRLTNGLGQLVQKRTIAYRQGTAAFKDPHTLVVTNVDGEQATLAFDQAVIATGSEPIPLAFLPANDDRIWTSRQALELKQIPGRLLVVGGGYIGLELGSVYAALGSAVTVVEMTPTLLPGVDRDLVRFLQKGLNSRFENIFLQTKIARVTSDDGGLRVTFENQDNGTREDVFDCLLAAVGRRPRTTGLGLENTAVQINDHGFIEINEQRRTAEPHIFAIGDVAGQPMLAHKASHEARVAVEVMAGHKVVYQPAAIPAVVFCDPEIAWAGLSESEAKEKGIEHAVARFPWAASGRAATLGRDDGLTKLVIDPTNERILGVGLVGPGAGELIAEAVMAIEMAANVTDLGLAVHPHPTLSETLMEAAHSFHGTATHYYRPVRGKK